MKIDGWTIYFLRRYFGPQRQELRAEVRRLKQELAPDAYVRHPTVKLYAAVMRSIKEQVPVDPFASQFALTGPLRKYGRVKKMGLSHRYRLFFRAFQVPQERAILILWLGYPRKEEDKRDCYAVFRKMVERGDFPNTLNDLLQESEEG